MGNAFTGVLSFHTGASQYCRRQPRKGGVTWGHGACSTVEECPPHASDKPSCWPLGLPRKSRASPCSAETSANRTRTVERAGVVTRAGTELDAIATLPTAVTTTTALRTSIARRSRLVASPGVTTTRNARRGRGAMGVVERAPLCAVPIRIALSSLPCASRHHLCRLEILRAIH